MRQHCEEDSKKAGSDKNVDNATGHTQERNVYLSLVESTTDSLYLVDRNCKYIFLNNNHLERLGLSKEEVVGRSYRDCHPPAQSDEFAKSIEEVFTTGMSLQHEFKSERDGRYFLRTFNLVKEAGSGGRITAVAVASKDITELKQSEEKYRSILENIEDGYYELDLAGHITFFNEACRRIYGYSRNEFTGMNAIRLADEENAQKAYKYFNKVYTTGTPLTWIDGEIIRKDGSKKKVEASASLMRDLTGQPIGFRGIVRDVTEQRQAEELYKTLAEMSLAAVFIVQDGKFVFINTSAIAYAGYSADEMIGQGADMIVHLDDKELVKMKSRDMLAGRSNQAFEFRMVTKQKEVRRISQTVTPIQYQGKPAILGNALDVTELKVAEDALRESEQRLHDIIDFLPDATYAIDRERKVIAWNRAIEEMTGIKASDMVGKGDYEYTLPFYGMRRPVLIDLVFLSDKEIKEKYSYVKKEGDALIAEADVPLRGGNPRALWGIARPLYDSRGSVVGAIESIRDVSERKQMEETVKWLAFHDGLTGLPNRRLFSDRLTMALAHVRRNRKKLSVMILDLDKFKQINDTLGHPVGDRLLRAVGERLMKILRTEDTVARIGGDEFMLLLPEISRAEDVILIAERILGAFTEPFNVDGYELHVTTSIGFAIYPENGEDGDALIKNADMAMYTAKEQGRNRYQGFLPIQDK
jgi:diguanylate cyclase (GGDEF)-like protein/PAS domain S-box-containing protein